MAQSGASAAPFASPVQEARTRPPGRPAAGARGRGDTAVRGAARQAGAARVAVRTAPGAAGDARPAAAAAGEPAAQQASANRLPWYEVANARKVAGGLRDCGPLEKILCRD